MSAKENDPYYLMLATVRGEGGMFWESEIYKKDEFDEGGLDVEELLNQKKAKLFIMEREKEMGSLVKAMQQAQVSNEIEGKNIKSEHTELVRARLNNEITEEEFQKRVKELL